MRNWCGCLSHRLYAFSPYVYTQSHIKHCAYEIFNVYQWYIDPIILKLAFFPSTNVSKIHLNVIHVICYINIPKMDNQVAPQIVLQKQYLKNSKLFAITDNATVKSLINVSFST